MTVVETCRCNDRDGCNRERIRRNRPRQRCYACGHSGGSAQIRELGCGSCTHKSVSSFAGERECSGGGGAIKRCPTGLANPTCTTKVETFQNGSESECELTELGKSDRAQAEFSEMCTGLQ